MRLTLALLSLCTCAGQSWEIGFGGGYGLYRNARVFAPAGTADAGFRNRFALTAFVSDHLYGQVSGEVRYTFQDGDPFLRFGAARSNIQGHSHAFHYDVVVHLAPARARLRPYVNAGIGAKVFIVNGAELPDQPLESIASLRTDGDVSLLLTPGAGVRLRLARQVFLRFDFRDYFTPFPKAVIAPARFATARGFFHQFTPLVTISYGF